MISDLSELPAVNSYLRRIGAEMRSLLTAVVYEKKGKYWADKAVIKFARANGEVTAPANYMPTPEEQLRINDVFIGLDLPVPVPIASTVLALPDLIAGFDPENVFPFRDENGNIVMFQVRSDTKDGGKVYRPCCQFSDGKARFAEPEGKLPLYNADRLKDESIVFIHEGPKGARACQRIVDNEDTSHPWYDKLATGCHVGWVGGALSPERTDWSVLAKAGIKKAYIISDNDPPGVAAVSKIAKQLQMPTFHVQFTQNWPLSFDLADPFPKEMFAEIDGQKHYVGPSMRSCIHPATWATNVFEIPNESGKGKPTKVVKLREHFIDQWCYIEESELFVNKEMPEIIRTAQSFNNMVAGFSDTFDTAKLLLQAYRGRQVKLCYRPDLDRRVVMNGAVTSINLHQRPTIKAAKGDPGPWLEYLDYMFPIKEECHEVKRYCATLISHPEVRMEYGLLLVSESQGIGKTTLGAQILRPLVGEDNTSFPSEQSIVNSDFNSWLAQKRLIIVNEIYSGHSWKAYQKLKSVITDKDVTVNQKYMKEYVIENWSHVLACSNSLKALKIEEDDRRWFVPTVQEHRWSRERFEEFFNWLRCGGLSIIKFWADHWKDTVKVGERAPMSKRKGDLINESYSEAQKEAGELSFAACQRTEPVVLFMRDVKDYVNEVCRFNVHDSDLDLRKAMKKRGMHVWNERLYVANRLQYVMLNEAAMVTFEECCRNGGRKLSPLANANRQLPKAIMGQTL